MAAPPCYCLQEPCACSCAECGGRLGYLPAGVGCECGMCCPCCTRYACSTRCCVRHQRAQLARVIQTRAGQLRLDLAS